MKRLRCAIYTRKSTDEGLDQAFNSLHAQREACEAYVQSQAGEGWIALPEIYDDGGFSGGNMERPALKRLLAAIRTKQVDVVVVYKVDRLTRSLGDFARIVEQFDSQGVSFVSVTQAFNTTSSMGRLTLNVLLSFAQFEREVTGERIRDKIAASKKKGMWMGGALPLGYDPPTDPTTRALVINPGEADTVRKIFERYLVLGSVHLLANELAATGARTKVTVSKGGVSRGGVPFNRGALFHVLRNRTYLGEIPHKDVSYPGTHPAIVGTDVFNRVQALLSSRAIKRRASRAAGSGASPLKGILFDADGIIMSPVASQNRHGRTYRYYVTTTLQQGRAAPQDDAVRRVSAAPLEALIGERLGRLMPSVPAFPNGIVARVDAMPASLVLSLNTELAPGYATDPDGWIAGLRRRLGPDERIWIDEVGSSRIKLAIAVRPQLSGGRTEYLSANGARAIRTGERDPALVKALRGAQSRMAQWLDPAVAAPPIQTQHDRNLARLAFLAPDIQRAILDGRQPAGLTLQSLTDGDIPLCWARQREDLGFSR